MILMDMKRPTDPTEFAVLAVDATNGWDGDGTAVTYVKAHTDVAHDLEFIPGLLYRAAGDEASRWLTEEGLADAIATRFDVKTGRPVSAEDAMLEDKCLPPWLAKIDNMILLEEDQKKKDEVRPAKGGGQPTTSVPKGSADQADAATFNLGDQTILSETVGSDDSLPEEMEAEATPDSLKPLSSYAPTFHLPEEDNVSDLSMGTPYLQGAQQGTAMSPAIFESIHNLSLEERAAMAKLLLAPAQQDPVGTEVPTEMP